MRRRPGMYIGGTDENALHHLAAEVLDNAMDEAVAGHATAIDVSLQAGNWLSVRDNGRGIPVDPHPKFKTLSALEVILTTLHSGGKFGGDAYATSGGLHGVGSSVVNALSESLEVEVARDRTLWRQSYARGKPTSKLVNAGAVQNRRGTTIRFKPDPEIFGPAAVPARPALPAVPLQGLPVSRRAPSAGPATPAPVKGDVPAEAVLHFPGGLRDSLEEDVRRRRCAVPEIWAGEADLPVRDDGRSGGPAEWAVTWLEGADGFLHSYCNTVPTPLGRHPRGRVPRRAAEGRARLGRAALQPPRRRRSRRGRRPAAWRPSCPPSCATRSSRARPRRS